MEVNDFLPKYPNINKTDYDVLNPYDDNFYEAIYRKKEFYENRLERVEQFPKERGVLMKHQRSIARFLSSHTPYDAIILVHSMGSGKTCSTIGAIEQIKSEDSTIKGALILAKGGAILNNFVNELVLKCTPGQYIPENFEKLSDLEKLHRVNKKVRDFYQFRTFAKFAKNRIAIMSDADIEEEFSNRIIVIDEVHNLRIQKENHKDTLEIYRHYDRFLHIVKNCKIILLSGTPMKDSPDEIASVMNLITPRELALPTGEAFRDEYLDLDNNVYTVKPEKVSELKERFKGRVSFLREMLSTVKRRFIGQKGVDGLKHFVVQPERMSKFQSKAYAHAYKQDHGDKKGVYINSRGASLFVYPDGSYGRDGFSKYITSKKGSSFIIAHKSGEKKMHTYNYSMNKELKKALKGETDDDTLANIREHSVMYAAVIEKILNTNGNCFVYSSLVKGSGAILFGLLLGLFGYSKGKGNESSGAPRYSILTNETATPAEIRRISNRFNRPDNMHGKYIKVIIGSKAVSEGFSFSNVIFEAVNTPHWNYSETAQAIARGIRLGSHNALLEAGEEPVVEIMQPVSLPREKERNKGVRSIDLTMYKISEDKDMSIRHILRLIMESAFDCSLNYMRNHVTGFDNQRECDYMSCDYACDGMNMRVIQDGLSDKELDYSTYQLYYANPTTLKIRRKIEQLFRENITINLRSIMENLEKEFTSEEIENALYAIREEEESGEFDYRMFLRVYSTSNVKKIMVGIEEMFREYFRLDLTTIMEQFNDPELDVVYTEFEILTALRTMINDNWIITNKYGLPSYLKEENDVFFLVNNLTVESTFFSEYYTKYPNISNRQGFTDIIKSISAKSLPRLVRRICKVADQKEFAVLMKSLPIPVQEMFIEISLIAKNRKIQKNMHIREYILDYFENYIKKVKGVYVSTLMEDQKILRCLEGKMVDDWQDCDEKYTNLLEQHEDDRKRRLREDNEYGIIGKYNPENGAFCIVDLNSEKSALVKLTGKGRASSDKRAVHTGKVCSDGGWKLPQLMEIAIRRLKIPEREGFRSHDSKEQMVEQFQKEKNLMNIYTLEELNGLGRKELRRALYWGTSKTKGGNMGIKQICGAIRQWLEDNEMLEIDNMCGVQGKKKLKAVNRKAMPVYRLETIIPVENEERFRGLKVDMRKLMKDCYKIEKYEPEMTDLRWVFVFSKSVAKPKMIAFISVDDNNVLHTACVAKNYRRGGIGPMVIGQAVAHVSSKKNPAKLLVNNKVRGKELVKMYKSFGFEIQESTNDFTWMIHKE